MAGVGLPTIGPEIDGVTTCSIELPLLNPSGRGG
jgi:hypothetical protein